MRKLICDPSGRIVFIDGMYVFDIRCPLFKSRYYARKRRDEIYGDRNRNGLEQSVILIRPLGDGSFGLWDCSDRIWLI